MFHVVIVLYNKYLSSIDTIYSSFKNDITNMVYIDNSIDNLIVNDNKRYAQCNKMNYFEMYGNKGLSKAYNFAIKNITFSKNDYVVILDDDTEIPNDFFYKMQLNINSNPYVKIFVPLILDNIGIMSPSKKTILGYKHSKILNFNKYIKKYSFINSGMCISVDIFTRIQYDENLFLDYIDFDFINTIRKTYKTNVIHIIDTIKLKQDFSGAQKNTFEQDFKRYSIFVKDSLVYHKKWYDHLLSLNLIRRTIKLTFQHKSIVFFKLLFHKLRESK